VLTIEQLANTPGWSLERLLGGAAGEKLAALVPGPIQVRNLQQLPCGLGQARRTIRLLIVGLAPCIETDDSRTRGNRDEDANTLGRRQKRAATKTHWDRDRNARYVDSFLRLFLFVFALMAATGEGRTFGIALIQ
jgi:hypothetical protein